MSILPTYNKAYPGHLALPQCGITGVAETTIACYLA
jgi:hypothetical protein